MTRTKRWALSVPVDGFSLAELPELAREGERLGYTDAWSFEADGLDCFTPLAAVATATRLRLGTAIANVFTRGPATLAMSAAGVADLAPGRFCLGIGAGSQPIVEAWNGGRFVRPATRVREMTHVLRAAFAGERVVFRGKTLSVDGFRLGRPPAEPIPIYVAALRPGMLQVAGEVGDGVILNWLAATDVPRVVALVREAAARAGRDPDAVEMWWWPDANVAASRREAIAEITMSLAAAGNHLSRFTTEGKHIPPELLPKVKILGERYTFGDHVAPGSANCRLIEELGLVDYLADRFAIAGTPAECITTIERAVEAGARRFWISIHFEDKLRFMRDWSTKIMPAFR